MIERADMNLVLADHEREELRTYPVLAIESSGVGGGTRLIWYLS